MLESSSSAALSLDSISGRTTIFRPGERWGHDPATSSELERCVRSELLLGVRHFIVDVSRLTSLDSKALSALARVSKDLTKAGSRCTIVGAAPRISKSLQITGLRALVEECPDLDSACRARRAS